MWFCGTTVTFQLQGILCLIQLCLWYHYCVKLHSIVILKWSLKDLLKVKFIFNHLYVWVSSCGYVHVSSVSKEGVRSPKPGITVSSQFSSQSLPLTFFPSTSLPFLLWEGETFHGYQPAFAYQVAVGLGWSSPIVDRQSSTFRERDPKADNEWSQGQP